MENFLRDLKIYIDRCGADVPDGNDEKGADSKLNGILSAHDADDDGKEASEMSAAVRAFLAEKEVNRRKLSRYCIDFCDPTAASEPICATEQAIVNHAGLREDDLYKLYRFVEKHASDPTFGETVYSVMDRHALTAPQVYKAAMLRRQDFSRVTDPKAKSVTKQIAWQIIIGLHCSIEEADEVLFSAGYVRRRSTFDLIMEYFLIRKVYDVMMINDALSEFGLKPFSCDRPVRDDDPFDN